MSEAQRVIIEKKDDSETERLKKELEEEKTKREDYEAKLALIAEKKFAERKAQLEKRATELIKDEAKRTELIEKIETGEQLKASELMLEAFEEPKAKKKSFASGVVPLESQLRSGKDPILDAKYKADKEGYGRMIRDLRDVTKDSEASVEERAQAQAVLDELLNKTIRSAMKGTPLNLEVTPKLDMEEENKLRRKKREKK